MNDLALDPFEKLQTWLQEAYRSEPNDPNAMALATAAPDGRPSVRMVLLKEVDQTDRPGAGLVFYTNTASRKGGELAANPQAALLFHWKSLRRQVRVEGRIERVSDDEADRYHASRPRISRLGAWASDQSRPLADRAELERRLAEAEARFGEDEIPRPAYWSGFRVIPDLFEFWEDRPFRLHDRLIWRRDGNGWEVGRLYP